jgi:hypothetical protein
MARQRVLVQRMAFGLVEPRHEPHEIFGLHRLIAHQDRAMQVEQVDHGVECLVIASREIDVQNLSAEPWFQFLGFEPDGGLHVFLPFPVNGTAAKPV